MSDRLRAAIGHVIAIALATASCAWADTLAWWRFEDEAVGTKLDADLGSNQPPFTTTQSASSADNQLRTFNTRRDRFPPDTSGTFMRPAMLPQLTGSTKNTRCVRFVGKQDFYSSGDAGRRPAIDSTSLKQFTVEGLFKLDVLSRENGDRYQTIVGKDGKPINGLPFQPFVAVVGGQDDQYMSRDCLSINIIDRSGIYRTAASRMPLKADQWYAFAAACNGGSLKLFINRFDGKGYQLEAQTDVDGGLNESVSTWTVGRGMFDSAPNSWLQGEADEIRICDAAIDETQWLTAGINELTPVVPDPEPAVAVPNRCVEGLADPAVLLHKGTYYLYGTGDTNGFAVWTSRDLEHWNKGPIVLSHGKETWGDSAFWAPGILERGGKFYLFYSSSGIIPGTGGQRSVRIGIAVADSPIGPFKEVVSRLPLIGRAVIDPQPFVDADGTPYLYFVADVSENNGAGQIYVVRLSDDLLQPVGEPIACISPSQPWEGTAWNEGPVVLREGETYVMMYSGAFWGSHDYAVGFATSPTPTGPWDKYDQNPILRRYAGLFGTGHNSVVRSLDGKSWLTFFHAHRGEQDATRDTYFAKLSTRRDDQNALDLKVSPWNDQ